MFGHVTHTHTHMGGECSHRCRYCYVGRGTYGRIPKYTGPILMVEKELRVNYGEGKRIFIEHCNDLFAADVPDEMIRRVLEHCCRFPKNDYLFHTKNPGRYRAYLELMPANRTLGITAETNRPTPTVSSAPPPMERLTAFSQLPGPKLVTIEPILKFDLDEFVAGIVLAKPDQVIIGADSKATGLQEPDRREILPLIAALEGAGLVVGRKTNLSRLL